MKACWDLKPPQPTALLAWYDKYGRDLPWRSHDGRAASPYHTWIAEIMLQQTTVITVLPYYKEFMRRWPNIRALAKADEQEVLTAWAGLGYYSRARNLLRCARIVVQEHGGKFPTEIAALKKLPGVGDYTANAIRAIAFDLPANVVDGNVERVMARIFAYEGPIALPVSKKDIASLAASVIPKKRHGDYAQALMDLGATICTPRTPDCPACPWRRFCCAYATGCQQEFPLRLPKVKIPERFATCLVTRNKDGAYFMVQRPATGLLGGLWEFPSTDWSMKSATSSDADGIFQKTKTMARTLQQPVTHIFTHFKLTMDILINSTSALPPLLWLADRRTGWFHLDAAPPLSTLTRKIAAAAIKNLAPPAKPDTITF